MDAPISGGCGCGAVRFEISEPLLSAGCCHRSRCQRRTGIRPQSRAFVAYAASWEEIPDDSLPRYDDARPGYYEGR